MHTTITEIKQNSDAIGYKNNDVIIFHAYLVLVGRILSYKIDQKVRQKREKKVEKKARWNKICDEFIFVYPFQTVKRIQNTDLN